MQQNIEFFKMKLAGRNIEVECHYRIVLAMCHNYLAKFDKPDFVVRAELEEIIKGRSVEVLQDYHPIPGVAFRYADEYIEPLIIYNKIVEQMVDFNTFLMHGAVIAKNDKAYMFTASSGVGKSTRIKLWMEEYPDSFVVNGDKPLIRITESEALACGTPWCGNEGWNTNTMVPLEAIFLLERADDGISTIDEISIGKAFPFLLHQTFRPSTPESMRKTIQLLKSLEKKVKIFKFHSTPTREAIRLAFETASS